MRCERRCEPGWGRLCVRLTTSYLLEKSPIMWLAESAYVGGGRHTLIYTDVWADLFNSRLLLTALGAALSFVLVFSLVLIGSASRKDPELFSSLNGLAANSGIAVLSSITTQFGSEVILALIGLLLYLLSSKDNTKILFGVLFAITISYFVLSILKGAYCRPRPYQVLSGVNLPIGVDEGSSIPSGHSTRAFAVAALITMQKGKKYGLLLLLSTGVAVSRVTIGLHFPSDVLAGAFLGTVLAVVSVVFLSRYVYPRLPPRFFMKGGQDMALKSAA